jgi:hypothetical protein
MKRIIVFISCYRYISCVLSSYGMLLRASFNAMVELIVMTSPSSSSLKVVGDPVFSSLRKGIIVPLMDAVRSGSSIRILKEHSVVN